MTIAESRRAWRVLETSHPPVYYLPPDDLVAVVSGWTGFLTFARIMLLAAKIDPGNLIVRSTSDDDWERAIRPASLIISDSLTTTYLDGLDGVRSFRVISDESLAELRSAIQKPQRLETLQLATDISGLIDGTVLAATRSKRRV